MTHEDLKTALVDFKRDVDFDMNEWYEKFSTLHARLTKRIKRDQAVPVIKNGHDADPPSQFSILHLPRKPGMP